MNKNDLHNRSKNLIQVGLDLANSVGTCLVERELSHLFLTHLVASGGYLNAVNYNLSMAQMAMRFHSALDNLNQALYSLQMLTKAGAVDVRLANEFFVQGKELSALLVCSLSE